MTVPSHAAAILAGFGFPPATAVEQQSGFDATVWRADLTDGRTVAIRLLRAAMQSGRELDALGHAAAAGLPAPVVLAAGRHEERDVIVMSWCPGRPMGEAIVGGGDVEELGRLFGRTQAGMHRPGVDGTVWCHLDFHPFNILVEDRRITGIVDWSNARTADPREDLAWTTVVLALGPVLLPHFADGIESFIAAWRAGYAELLPFPDDDELRPFLSAAAQRQHSNWLPRVAAGEVLPEVTDATAAIAARWTH